MSIVASDLVVYGTQNVAETDGVTQGGSIDLTVRYVFDDTALANSLADSLDVESDNAGDTTQTVTITGRDASGAIVTEVYSLNGTTPQTGSQVFQSILKIVKSASTIGNVVVSDTDPEILVTIEPAVLEVRRPFYNVAADVSIGDPRDFYEKIFFKNNNGVNALLGAAIVETADTLSKVTFDLEDAVDDNNSTADRLDTVPTGMLGSFDGASKNVPGTDLAPGSAIGVWLKFSLSPGDAAALGTYTLRISGQST